MSTVGGVGGQDVGVAIAVTVELEVSIYNKKYVVVVACAVVCPGERVNE